MRPTILLLTAVLAAACGEPESQRPGPEPPADVVANDSTPPAGPVAAWRQRVPEAVLLRRGACPFECCVYGDWVAESRIPVVPTPDGSGALPAFHLEPGTRFRTDSGHVRVNDIALVAVTAEVQVAPGHTLQPGDTLVLLDYVGEGYYNGWLEGEILQVEGFWSPATAEPKGELIGEHRTEWWVHATAPDGRTGWFRADAEGVELAGADACAGPPQP